MGREGDWLAQAQRDLCRAELDVAHGFWEWACFTSQQAAEKALKALLLRRGESARGHALTPLLRHLAHDDPPVAVPESLLAGARRLDAHYVLARYPNGFSEGKPADYYDEAQAKEALDAARAIVRFCADHLA